MPQVSSPLSLTSAVKRIKKDYDFAVRTGKGSPFFLLIGAGVSVPQVPLAYEIIRDCKSFSEGSEAPTAGVTVLEEYSYWLDQAFPSPAQRQDYFQTLIKGKPIPLANFRLAHLLLGEADKKPLVSLVVTTNFDDFLTRALQLFGKEHVLCDSPTTTPRLDLSNADLLQIVHVHGTYHFYDIKNLSGEVKAAAAASEETTATMSSLLESILRERSPIVIGYGGWEGDVFMKSLNRRLRAGGLQYPLYWCCYQRNQWQSLPDWLKSHPSVCFVEPEKSVPLTAASAPDSGSGSSVTAAADAAASVLGKARDLDPKLDAQLVFGELIQTLQVAPPKLTQNPIQFFADQLDRSVLQESGPQTTDIYRIKSTVDEMRAAANWIIDYRNRRSATQQQLHAIREGLRGANYGEAMSLVTQVQLKEMNDQEKAELWDMAWEIISSAAFSERPSDETLAMLDRFEEIAALVPPGSETSKRVGMGLSYRIVHLFFLGRSDKGTQELVDFVQRSRQSSDPAIHVSAIELLFQLGKFCLQGAPATSAKYFEMVISMIGQWKNEPLQEYAGQAMFGLGLALLSTGQKVEAVDEWRKLLSSIDAGTTTLPQQAFAQMLVLMGLTLAELDGRSDEALAVFDEVVKRFGELAEPGVREQVAKALFNKGVMLDKQNHTEKALEAYDELVRRFGDATEPTVREQVAAGLRNKGVILGQDKQTEKALEAFDELVRRFGDATEPTVREQVAAGLRNKGVILGQDKQTEKALEAYDELVRRFGDATEPTVREQVAAGLRNKGVILDEDKQTEKALEAFDELVRRFGDATEQGVREQVAAGLRNKGVRLGKEGQTEKAVEVYDELVRRFGDATEPGVREQVAAAVFGKALMFGKLSRYEKALEAYDEVVRRFGEATEPTIREQVATALLLQGATLGEHHETDKALKAYDELVRRFGDATEPGVREQIAGALFNKGVTLAGKDQTEKALEAYNEVVRRFGDATEPAVREQVAAALFNKGAILGEQNQTEKALEAYNEVVRRFGDATEPAVREQVAKALRNKGVILGEQDQTEKALEAYNEIVRRFGDATEPGIQEQVGNALNGIAFNLLCDAKLIWKDKGHDEAFKKLEDARNFIERALRYLPSDPTLLGNKGYILFLMGETDAGAAVLREAIRLGGEEIRKSELADSEIHALPEDHAFRDLIRSIPTEKEVAQQEGRKS